MDWEGREGGGWKQNSITLSFSRRIRGEKWLKSHDTLFFFSEINLWGDCDSFSRHSCRCVNSLLWLWRWGWNTQSATESHFSAFFPLPVSLVCSLRLLPGSRDHRGMGVGSGAIRYYKNTFITQRYKIELTSPPFLLEYFCVVHQCLWQDRCFVFLCG